MSNPSIPPTQNPPHYVHPPSNFQSTSDESGAILEYKEDNNNNMGNNNINNGSNIINYSSTLAQTGPSLASPNPALPVNRFICIVYIINYSEFDSEQLFTISL